jgi:hypothetical protein
MLRERIVASHHLSSTIAQNDQSVRVLGHQLFVQPTSNPVPPRTLSFFGGMRCVRASHVAVRPKTVWLNQLTYSRVMPLSFAALTPINRQCGLRDTYGGNPVATAKRNPGQFNVPGPLQVVVSACWLVCSECRE